MAARGRIPPKFEGRSTQAPGVMRHGPFHDLSPASGLRLLEPLPPQLLENKIAVQAEEVKRLAGDNHRLASTHVALREELIASHQEVQKLKKHIRSNQTESDIQVRVLLDKIAKMEVDIRAGDSLKKELQQARIEVQSLVAARQELSGQIQKASQELQKAHSDVKSLPDLQAVLDSLVPEHQRLRATFEHEKNKNIEFVEQMKATEKNLIGMAREVELLRAKNSNAEKRVHAPDLYGAAIPFDNGGTGTYVDAYGRAQGPTGIGRVGESMVQYGGSNGVVTVDGAAAVWSGPYDPSVSRDELDELHSDATIDYSFSGIQLQLYPCNYTV
ncbi:hypothetical protein L6164_011581 [Bauhinia variegata]|uniref:Uncharacterized protein n=1 Tax=Bauhinia variegata TaxID=167791 RepID=A0ACB9P7J8_BAUVA|nr:hypothetical protein L6164_011581 [Bauhinia variegata]